MDWSELQDARLAVITEFVSRTPGGHVGRTALMKFCYLLQTVREVPLGYRFTLYSYGPFDSSVLSDLSTAETLGAVQSEVKFFSDTYSYQITKGESGDFVLRNGAKFLDKYRRDIDWVLEKFGSHTSADLELESTIVYVDREAAKRSEQLSVDQLSQLVRKVKPRFNEDRVRQNVRALLGMGLLKSC
jgi:hypothetical protein